MNQKELNEFPPEVIDEVKYYVYRLIDPRNGETFYIGKGKGNRVFQHMRGAIKLTDSDSVSEKINTIHEILNAGLDVIHVIHRHGMDEKTAMEVEAAVIDSYPNTTNILGGSRSNDFGPMNALEIVNKYHAEVAEFHHRVLMISVSKSLAEKGLYDATRFCWKLSASKLKKVEYVLAVKQGIIIGVFKPTAWKRATIENFPEFNQDVPGRFGFVGREADQEIQALYLRKRVPDEYRKRGAANPVKYYL